MILPATEPSFHRLSHARPLAGSAVVSKRTRPSTRTPKTEPTAVTAPPPANDDQKPAPAAASGEKPAVVTARKPSKLRGEPASVSASLAQDDRAAAPSAIVAAKHRREIGRL
jgi:hypothetical protein